MKKVLVFVFAAAMLTACGPVSDETTVAADSVVVAMDTVAAELDTIVPADTISSVKK
jgi:uncharacterized protein YcfL